MAATVFRQLYRVCVFRLRKLFINAQEEGVANGTEVRGTEEQGRIYVDAYTQTGMGEEVELETETVQLEVGRLIAEEIPASKTDKNGCLGKYRSSDREKKNEKEKEKEEEEAVEKKKGKQERQEEGKDRDIEVKSSDHSQTYSRPLTDEVKPEYTGPPSFKRNIAPFEQEASEDDSVMSRLYDPAFVTDPDFELLRLDVFEPIRVSQILPQMEAEEKHRYLTKV